MKKFIIFVLLVALAVIFIPWLQPEVDAGVQHQATFLVGQRMYINDGQAKAMDAAPFIRNSRVYVPARYLGRALGVPDSDIVWDGASKSVVFCPGGAAIKLTAGSALLFARGREQQMDASPLLVGGRMYIPARWLAEALGYEVKWDEAGRAVLVGPPGGLPEPPAEISELPVVGTYENLKALLAGIQNQLGYGLQDKMRVAAPLAGEEADNLMKDSAAAQSPEGRGSGAAAADYSRTNIQVEGVDEADIVKTDGSYIYQVNGERVVISKAYPPEDMKVVTTLDFTEKNFTPQEMYVDGRHLILIGHNSGYWDMPVCRPMPGTNRGILPGVIPPYRYDTVKAVVYDIRDKSNVKQVRELELCGRYVSSRKIGQSFYLVANKNIYYYPLRGIEDVKPFYRDTAAGGELVEIDFSSVKCFPGFVEPNYLVVAGINLDRPQEEADVQTFLGSGENIYASTENLYVAVTGCRCNAVEFGAEVVPGPLPAGRNTTRVYKFSMDDGRLKYLACGEVPGTVLNQFSMDEHNGYFRVATTAGDVWRVDEYTSKNNVYVLDEEMNVIGKLEGIAPGERIYSVRFVGDRGYMVTFKTVDPFFVIDFKEPRRPRVLGALKIPGYSDYLHPYDENHIIGFGKDTIELGQKDSEGRETGSMAFYTGMKMALFDVTDVSNPVEMSREIIGDRGTDSELLHNHKALLFSRDKNLLAFPVKVIQKRGFPAYGEFTFQGAYVYSVDLDSGFALKGKITHLSGEDYLKAGRHWYDSDKNVKRVLYINDTLYTISGKYIKANDLTSLEEIKTLELS